MKAITRSRSCYLPTLHDLERRIFVDPRAFPSLLAAPPASANWQHGIIRDGYRTLLVIDRGKAQSLYAEPQ